MLLQLVCHSMLDRVPILILLVKFDIEAVSPGYVQPRCIKDFVVSDTLVVVTAWVSGTANDGQKVDIDITDTNGNKYGKPRNVVGESRSAFTVQENTYLQLCFYNELQPGGTPHLSRHIELDVDIGADALDWSAIQKNEKLQPMEAELRRIESTLQEVVNEMEYLKYREQRLRDTNESTNERVKSFAILGFITLIGSGVWRKCSQ